MVIADSISRRHAASGDETISGAASHMATSTFLQGVQVESYEIEFSAFTDSSGCHLLNGISVGITPSSLRDSMHMGTAASCGINGPFNGDSSDELLR